jgi:3-methyladenine DNA glycosylase AlkD
MQSLIKELNKLANPDKAQILQSFFKTKKGQYGEGDIFLGITVPQQRQFAKKYNHLSIPELQKLLNSKIHEQRLIALLILTNKFKRNQKEIFEFYLKNAKQVNNWDLVDLTAPNIIGNYLQDKDKSILYQLARSPNLWEKRIAIVSTYTFIRNNQFKDTLAISKILLNDKHDLIHKAVGWMLREVGKRDQNKLETFLKQNYNKVSRTTLRYAIERFPEEKRRAYLKNQI